MPELDKYTPEQIAALKILLARPDLMPLWLEFLENMSAARRVMKWIAWIGGFATGLAALLFYIRGALNGGIGEEDLRRV